MDIIYMFSVWVHVVAAAVWIGGMVFIVLVLVPVSRRTQYRDIAPSLIHWTGVRFRWVGWVCLVLLLLTGPLNLYLFFNLGYEEWMWQELLDTVLGVKVLLVMVILFLSAMHDFVIGPRATSLWLESAGSAEGLRLRRQASWIGRLTLLLGLVVAALGVMIVRS